MELYSVLVTGANRGIGLEFVKQLTEMHPPPKHVFATYRSNLNLEALNAIREKCSPATTVHLIQMDVTNESDIKNAKNIVESVVKENGLTVLINNAGVAQVQEFPNMTVDFLNFHFTTNAVAPIMVTQEMYPLLRASASRTEGDELSFSRAGILNISSLAGCITQTGVLFPYDLAFVPYKISKAALNMAMKSISVTSEKHNVLIVTMCPGWVKTDLGSSDAELDPKDSISAMLDTISKLNEKHNGMFMNRFGVPYEF